MTISLLVDWLSITVKHWPGEWPFFSLQDAEQVTPRYGYKTAWKDGNGAMAYVGGNADSLHLVWSGEALNQLRKQGVGLGDMLRLIEDVKAKVTRLDIAADWRDPGIQVADLKEQFDRGNILLHVKRWSYLESENKGQTLYVGSRASERMLRIYNKKAQLARSAVEVDQEWIRIEAELKDDQAAAAARALLDNSLGAVLAAHIAKCFIMPFYKPWTAFIAELPTPALIMPSVVGKSNTDQWLLNVVVPILKKRLDDPDFERLWSVLFTG